MKELRDIIQAYDDAKKKGVQTALATVVHVQGSAYRRPGARMLISAEGKLTGAISGGCLEGDALRKAQLVMIQRNPILVLYDTTDDDDAKVGVGLGCNGLIYILIEPIDVANPLNPLELLRHLITQRQPGVLVTLFCFDDKKAAYTGTAILVTNSACMQNLNTPKNLLDQIIPEGLLVLQQKTSLIKTFDYEVPYTALFDYKTPATSLIIAGAGNDAIPLAKFAAVLGWQVTIVDGRPNYATSARFPDAQNIIVCKPGEVLKNIIVDAETVFVLMTHNYNYDVQLFKTLLPLNIAYIGSLGPRVKKELMLNDLRKEGLVISDHQLQKVYGPTGLDIGAEGAEEIALSIIAEIKMVLANADGRSLRKKLNGIHA